MTNPVTVVFDLTDEHRKALRFREGRRGLATNTEVESWIRMVVAATFEDVVYEYEHRKTRG